MNNYFEQTRLFWGNEIIKGNLIYPDEFVVRFIKRNYINREGLNVLDFGCGAGRHSLFLAMEGYNVIAMDYTDEAVRIVNERKNDLSIKVIQNIGLDVPLTENSIDAIVAHGSLFYNNKIDTITLLKNLKKCLKEGGKFWTNWRGKEDSLFSRGELVSDGLYKLDEGTGRKNCCYLFLNEEEVREIYEKAGFTIVSLEKYQYTENNQASTCFWYHVIAK